MIDISKWAFENKKLIYFLIAVLIVGGAYSSYEMSKLEDPEITVKLAMVVTTYPGASAHQVELEVTDVLEKNIRSMGNIDNVESYSYNDLSLIQVELKTTVKETDVEQCWDLLRRKVKWRTHRQNFPKVPVLLLWNASTYTVNVPNVLISLFCKTGWLTWV